MKIIQSNHEYIKLSIPFLLFSILFVTCLLTSNIVATKIISLFGLFLPGGIVVFPLSYLLGDVLTEVYGYQKTKLIIWLAFLGNLFMVSVILLVQYIQPAPYWHNQLAYETVLGFTARLLIASFTAFLVGSFINSFVMSKMKVITKGKYLWTRTIGSTLLGEGIDTLLFILIAFYGILPVAVIPSIIITQWLFKVAYEVVMTPITYTIISLLKRREKLDHFDKKISYNPFVFLPSVEKRN